MSDLTVNFTDWARLLAGIIAFVIGLGSMLLWLIPVLMLGPVWRRLTRPKRTLAIRLIIGAWFVMIVAAMLLVRLPTYVRTHGEGPEPPVTAVDSIGITGWYEQHSYHPNPWAPNHRSIPTTESYHVNAMGIVGMIVAAAGLWMIGRRIAKRYRLPDGRCDECGYDVSANLASVCSECGAPSRVL